MNKKLLAGWKKERRDRYLNATVKVVTFVLFFMELFVVASLLKMVVGMYHAGYIQTFNILLTIIDLSYFYSYK